MTLLDDVVAHGTRGAWNFGPPAGDVRSVQEVIEFARSILGPSAPSVRTRESELPEDGYLALDSTAILQQCNWRNLLDFETSVAWSLSLPHAGQSLTQVVMAQVTAFDKLSQVDLAT